MGLTLANQLTIARMIMIPLLITLVLSNLHGWGFWVFVLAGITDALDGIIARRMKQKSNLGAILDPMADKLLMTACFILLAVPDHPRPFPEFEVRNHIPIFLTIVTISRDVFIVMIALVIHLASGVTRFAPTLLGKLTTFSQVMLIGTVLLCNYLGREAPILILGLSWATLATTLLSGFHYIYHVTRMAGTDEPGPWRPAA